MPLLLVRCNLKNPTKKKVVQKRREEIKSIFKTLQEISKVEMERSKKLFQEHKTFFDEPEPVVEIVDDSENFFKEK